MPDTKYLQKRRQGWYVRLAVPPALQTKTGKTHVIKSLQTRDLKTAQQRRWVAIAEIKGQLEALRGRRDGWVPKGTSLDTYARNTRTWYQDIANGPTANLRADPDEPTSLQQAKLVVSEIAEEIEEDYGHAEALRFHRFVTTKAPILDEAFETWLAEIAGSVKQQTIGHHRVVIGALKQFMPGLSFVTEVTRRQAGLFVTHLLGAGRLQRKTIKRYLSSLSSFWRWMGRRGYVDGANPWADQGLPKANDGTGKSKREFSESELVALLSVPAPKIRRGRYAPAIHDLMRLSLMTGCRLDELCSLRSSDIDHKRKTIEIRSGKTVSAKRIIPAHALVWSILERRGRGKGAEDYLFNELTPGGPDQKRGWKISSYFAQFRKRVLPASNGTDFHSFRRCFATYLERARSRSPVVNDSSIAELMGHKKGTIALDVYSGGLQLDDLRKALDLAVGGMEESVLKLI